MPATKRKIVAKKKTAKIVTLIKNGVKTAAGRRFDTEIDAGTRPPINYGDRDNQIHVGSNLSDQANKIPAFDENGIIDLHRGENGTVLMQFKSMPDFLKYLETIGEQLLHDKIEMRVNAFNDGSALRETLDRYFPGAPDKNLGSTAPSAPIHISISALASDVVARLTNLMGKDGDLSSLEQLVTQVTGKNPPPSAGRLRDDPMPDALVARIHIISDLLQHVENRLGGLIGNLGESL